MKYFKREHAGCSPHVWDEMKKMYPDQDGIPITVENFIIATEMQSSHNATGIALKLISNYGYKKDACISEELGREYFVECNDAGEWGTIKNINLCLHALYALDVLEI